MTPPTSDPLSVWPIWGGVPPQTHPFRLDTSEPRFYTLTHAPKAPDLVRSVRPTQRILPSQTTRTRPSEEPNALLSPSASRPAERFAEQD